MKQQRCRREELNVEEQEYEGDMSECESPLRAHKILPRNLINLLFSLLPQVNVTVYVYIRMFGEKKNKKKTEIVLLCERSACLCSSERIQV